MPAARARRGVADDTPLRCPRASVARSLQTEFAMLKVFVGLLCFVKGARAIFTAKARGRTALHKARALYKAKGKRQRAKVRKIACAVLPFSAIDFAVLLRARVGQMRGTSIMTTARPRLFDFVKVCTAITIAIYSSLQSKVSTACGSGRGCSQSQKAQGNSKQS